MRDPGPVWVNLTPNVAETEGCVAHLEALVKDLRDISHGVTDTESTVLLLEEELERARQRFRSPPDSVLGRASTALANLIIDLRKHGWEIRIRGDRLAGRPPRPVGANVDRSHRRALLAARRMEQLREPATRTLITEQERGRLTSRGRASVFNLMRDGRELMKALDSCAETGTINARTIANAIKPYIQFVTPEGRCEHTDLRLMDIWRYFRHTWSNSYESVPGRSLMMLVRDAAAPFHPVIGIAALGSATVKLKVRDEFIGWDDDAFLEMCRRFTLVDLLSWVRNVVPRFMQQLYRDDFISDGMITGIVKKDASSDIIKRLRQEGRRARAYHTQLPNTKSYKGYTDRNEVPSEYWQEQAESPLFRSKRANQLANLLEVQVEIEDLTAHPAESVREFLAIPRVPGLLRKLARMRRSLTVGTEIADLTVCGAIPPYNELLGGKLVALLAVSPEVVVEYRRRYGNAASVIASSMAGTRTVKPANLVFISTTGLYGIRPSQYDRISMPADVVGGASTQRIRFKFLSHTVGWGTFQFSKATKVALDSYLEALQKRRVRNIFGEGASPRLRALRDGLDALGLDSDRLLVHGQTKLVYAVKLAANVMEYLLGFDSEPEFFFDLEESIQATKAIAVWWQQRWVVTRLKRRDVRDRIVGHTLVHPIRHGARVVLPEAELEQIRLFD